MTRPKNRRKTERYDSNLFLELVNPVLKESIGRGVVVDVSLSGLAIETEAELDVGHEIECHVEIPVSIRAKVVRRITPGQLKQYGLMLVGQGFMDKLVFRRLLKGHKKTKKV